jgi:hypothetical protein
VISVKEHTITYHIKEIYKSEELEKKGTARKIRVVRVSHGDRCLGMTQILTCPLDPFWNYKENSAFKIILIKNSLVH